MFTEIAGFTLVPGTDLFINEDGIVISAITGQELKPFISKHGKKLIGTNGRKGKNVTANVLRLLALAFFSDHPKLGSDDWMVWPKDGDALNTFAGNIEIIDRKEYCRRRAKKKVDEILKANGYREPGIGECVECTGKPGYFWIPLTYTPLVINRDGDVWSLLSNKHRPPFVNEDGYHRLSFFDYGKGKMVSDSVHRMYAKTFIRIPKKYQEYDIGELHVNHLDGVKTSCKDNLEWCLPIENIEHAVRTGLYDNGYHILARDIRTDEVLRFKSLVDCSARFGLNIKSLRAHLNCQRSAGRITFDWHVLKFDDGRQWPKLLMESYEQNSYRWICNTLVTEVSSGNRFLFSSVSHACNALGLWHTQVSKFLAVAKPGEAFKGYTFEIFDDKLNTTIE